MLVTTECEIGKNENNFLNINDSFLEILLLDHTTGKNIIWATDNYKKYGEAYSFAKEIKIELITNKNNGLIRPRTKKSKEEQQIRVRDKGEVFTPSWMCKAMNDLLDSTTKSKNWQEYVSQTVLEITCGEAPFLVSRYDVVTGDYIEIQDRIGLLDRKLQIIGKNTETREEWLKWATIALQNIYGFEWQGDSLLIARENLLLSMKEYFETKFAEKLDVEQLKAFAEIISWNIWQMDGLKFVIPNSCCTKEVMEEDLFERRIVSKPCMGCKIGFGEKSYLMHNGAYCKIKNWKTGKIERFVDSLKGGHKND